MARIAFFGTPDFALPALDAIFRFCGQKGHEIVIVVTQRDQPSGRGQKLLPPPVKTAALSMGIPVFQPGTLKKNTKDGDEFFECFQKLKIDLAIVVAYGKLITERLLRLSRRGFVNLHASLLPRFRGAAPIQRAIEFGDHETGVCLMELVKGLDEGDVYTRVKTPILPFDTSQSLLRRLAILGAHILYENLDCLLEGTLKKTPQSEEGIVYAHMVHKHEGIINFCEPVAMISRKVRAFDPAPGSFGFIRGKRVKFFDSFFIEDLMVKRDVPPGSILVVGAFLGVKAKDGIVYFQRMQVEGKKTLAIKDAVLGFPIIIGDKISPTDTEA